MAMVRERRTPYQEQTMQKHQKAVPIPGKTRQPAKSKTVRTAPVVLDEKALRQVAGGLPLGPNGGW